MCTYALSDVALAKTINGVAGGPFLKSVPPSPAGWTAFSYSSAADGTFTVSASGDGAAVQSP